MMSPLAKGLFSKAIAQSGTNLAAWSQPAHKGVAQARAVQLAESFKCYEPNSWPTTLDCLRKVSAENVTAAFYDFFVISLNEIRTWILFSILKCFFDFSSCGTQIR